MPKTFRDKIGTKMSFYCVKCRKKHTETVDDVVVKKLKHGRGRRVFAIATCARHGNKLFRILGKA